MKNKVRQIRITVPKWVAELKGWNDKTHLEVIPLDNGADKPITKEAIMMIKEVKKDG
ncbi:MAG: hypothetical protein PHH54_06070 [Candidatus Nanoarchaeia archaeon]|nr:hypothetical protein [Candidatus Nanoarchaeia archaeon]MDD5741521.1 hypothetical protein [Candidatus Nanoarchaeia archaeon]